MEAEGQEFGGLREGWGRIWGIEMEGAGAGLKDERGRREGWQMRAGEEAGTGIRIREEG